MDTHTKQPNYQADFEGEQIVMPTWCAFALGGILTFLFVYIGIGRPAANELAQMRRQMGTLEQSIWEVAGHKEDVLAANDLLASLKAQQSEIAEARQALEEMQQLHRQLAAETDRVQTAMAVASHLGALKDMLVANSARADEASRILSSSEDLWHRLATAADTTGLALQASNDLLRLHGDLVGHANSTEAQDALEQLIGIRRTLDAESLEVAQAREQITELISLKDSIVSQTGDLGDAIETLELTKELNTRFHEAALSFEQIRHWMVEIVAMEPLLQRARASIEPLLDLADLRRLAPAQLRMMARVVSKQCQAQLASKPDAIVSPSDTTHAPTALDDRVLTE